MKKYFTVIGKDKAKVSKIWLSQNYISTYLRDHQENKETNHRTGKSICSTYLTKDLYIQQIKNSYTHQQKDR